MTFLTRTFQAGMLFALSSLVLPQVAQAQAANDPSLTWHGSATSQQIAALNQNCVRIDFGETGWQDNFLCSDVFVGLRWFRSGVPHNDEAEYNCTPWIENLNGFGPEVGAELCVPKNMPYSVAYHPAGLPNGFDVSQCIVALESPVDVWKDNLVCLKREPNAADPAPAKDIEFTYSTFGERLGEYCVALADSELAGEEANILCNNRGALTWSDNGQISGMECARYYEEQGGAAWNNNYLCSDTNFPFELSFLTNVSGIPKPPNAKTKCFPMREPDPSRLIWDNNYICATPNDKTGEQVQSARAKLAKAAGFDVPNDPIYLWNDEQIKRFIALFKTDEELSNMVLDASVKERIALGEIMTDTQRKAVSRAAEMILTWSDNGVLPGQHCIKIDEEQFGWDNNFLCSTRDHGLRWSNYGRLPGMKCFSFNETVVDGTASNLWKDNYLCQPPESEYDFLFITDGKTAGLADRCIKIFEGNGSVNASWNDNFLCYDRDRLVSYDGQWELASPPCPSCGGIEFTVSYGMEKGKEKSTEMTHEASVNISQSFGSGLVEGVGYKRETSIEIGYSFSHAEAIAESFSQSKSEEFTLSCGLGALWQWTSTADMDCSFGSACPALTAKANLFQCTVPGDEPLHDPTWEPCEPVFINNVTSTPGRIQNGTETELPGAWRCRVEDEILIDQATYGRNCGADLGNVTDLVARKCRTKSGGADNNTGKCEVVVDMDRFGRPGGDQCKHDFEVLYTCTGDGDKIRSLYIPGEAGYDTLAQLNCHSGTTGKESVQEPTCQAQSGPAQCPAPGGNQSPSQTLVPQGDAPLPYQQGHLEPAPSPGAALPYDTTDLVVPSVPPVASGDADLPYSAVPEQNDDDYAADELPYAQEPVAEGEDYAADEL
ncbi:MAG: hypothetical protein ACRBB0_08875, partial [Pelagimonas sp.]|uniref:hypothetical protein n=1 Tax=Pelagimonas sp. TaxID=2073170 RepID=UPI003D6C2AFA